MNPGKRFTILATAAGFLAGCLAMHFILPRETPPAKTPAPNPPDAIKQAQTQSGNTADSDNTAAPPNTGAQTTPTTLLRGSAARRLLAGIKRDKVASVDVQFFAENEFGVPNGKLSQQLIDFLELSLAEAGALSDLAQAAKAEMWTAAKTQAQVSRTGTGGIVIKIPPIEAGPDIHDKVMDGFRTILGDDRFNDMMLYNKISGRAGEQLEALFNEFGAEDHTVTIEKTGGDRYKITDFIVVGKPGTVSSTYSYTGALEQIEKRSPELLEFIPAPAQ
ncbi:MAG: hypothetical protein LBM04_03740 [Opitutaceae bacterium]|jgi:hypothetical protein|nr:hypothetical protein [Opitutaceae bacterium]